jgi:hypothetical protein
MGKRTFTTEVSSTALIASESQGLSHPVHIATYIARVCFNHASTSSAYGWSGRPKCDPWSLRKRYGKDGVLRRFNQSENSLEPYSYEGCTSGASTPAIRTWIVCSFSSYYCKQLELAQSHSVRMIRTRKGPLIKTGTLLNFNGHLHPKLGV